MANIWVKRTVIFSVLAKKFSLPVQKYNYLQFYDICSYKYGWKFSFPTTLLVIRDKHPGSATLFVGNGAVLLEALINGGKVCLSRG
jgi:hypothetical protein